MVKPTEDGFFLQKSPYLLVFSVFLIGFKKKNTFGKRKKYFLSQKQKKAHFDNIF